MGFFSSTGPNTAVAVERTRDMIKPNPNEPTPWYKKILDFILKKKKKKE
jgi:hypothetical protein